MHMLPLSGPPYTPKAIDVIYDLVAENREVRDVLIEERNAKY